MCNRRSPPLRPGGRRGEKINQAIHKAPVNPDVQRQLSVAGIPGKPMPLAELAGLMNSDHDRRTTVVKASSMTPQ